MRYLICIYLASTILSACDDDYPPCSPDTGALQGPGAPTGPTDPGPILGPVPDPDQEASPTYSTNDKGDVCECGPYEIGCVDSPEKARAAKQPGSYCPYPRQEGDPVTPSMGGFYPKPPIDYSEDPINPRTCTCTQSITICGETLSTEMYGILGKDAATCIARMRYALSRTPGAYEPGLYHIECWPNQ